MESNEESIVNKSPEKMETEEGRNEDDLLQSASMDDVGGGTSVSSSILNSDDEDDGINVTIREIPGKTEEKQLEQRQIYRPKLSGAKKKRFKKLLLDGHNRDEALSMVLMPVNESTSKRPRNMNLSNTSDGNPIPKKPKGQHGGVSVNDRMSNIRQGQSTAPVQQATYRDVAKWVRVGILPKNYPQIQLTTDQMNVVQDAILYKITQQRRESFKSKFANCWQRTGHLVINCQDTETADWLDSVIPALVPWEGAELTVVDAGDIPRPDILIGFFPQSVNDSNDSIRVFIESQNDGLCTDNWRIIRRNTLYENHVEWLFTVDEESMQHFKDCNFIINYKFGQTSLRKKGTYKSDPKKDNERSEDGVDKIVPSSDEPNCHDPEICQSSGNIFTGSSMNQHELSVPETSEIEKSLAVVKFSKHSQLTNANSGHSDDQNHVKIMNQIRSGTSKDRNLSGTLKNPTHSEPSKNQKPSGTSLDRNQSGCSRNRSLSKDRNRSGTLKNPTHSEPSKNQKPSGASLDRNQSGCSRDRSLSKDRNLNGTLKNPNHSEPSKNQKPSGTSLDRNQSGRSRDRSGPPKDRSLSGPSKDQNLTGLPKDRKHSGPSKDQKNSKGNQ